MSVTILERPIGVILDDCVSATINEDYNGFATINHTSHGRSDNDWVYIQSNVENYNGFWQIDVINTNEFALKNIDGTYLAYIVGATITYCPQQSTHGWSCVHLPIVYQLSNNRWPTNSVDTVRTISSITNDNGYANLNLSGSLGTFEDLAFIKISNANDSDFDGVYQIIDKLETNDITINLAYSSVTNSGLVGASIQLYYNSYNIVVNVYSGLNASHYWASQKPYELAATLNFIPDSDNKIKFSISDILKSYVDLKNNLLGPTLPNDISQFTQFYISVAEQYDTSDGYTVSTFESGFNSDQSIFEGYAVNSKLEFKNIHSGYLSEYVMTNTTAKFLTLFTIPVLFSCNEETPDCYHDISFLIENSSGVVLNLDYYTNGALAYDSQVSIPDNGAGLYRIPLDADCSYDQLKVNLKKEEQFLENNTFTSTIAPWTSEPSTPGNTWVSSGGNIAAVSISSSTSPTEFLEQTFEEKPIGDYKLLIKAYKSDSADFSDLYIYIYNDGVLVQQITTFNLVFAISEASAPTVEVNFTATGIFDQIKIRGVFVSGSFHSIGITTCDLYKYQISEIKTFDIECGCSNQEIRLTWLNYLDGFDYWNFIAEKEYQVDIEDAQQTTRNIFPEWPNSYGSFADTIDKQTFRNSRTKILVRSQFLTQSQVDGIEWIKKSPLVQIINSRQDKRTVLVDTDSFTKYTDGDKTFSIQFTISYTDQSPSQTS